MSEGRISNMEEVAFNSLRKLILQAVDEAISKLDPADLVSKELSASHLGSRKTDVRVIGFGKASAKMMAGALQALQTKPAYSGIIIPKGMEQPSLPAYVEILRGSHPILDSSSVESTRRILSHMAGLTSSSEVLVLISGGGSALFELPVDGITVHDFASVSRCVMNSGGDIKELNGIRHTMSQVKGGKLARFLYPASVTALIISDVPGDDISIVASGPLVPSDMDEDFRKNNLSRFSRLCPDLSRLMDRLDVNLPHRGDTLFEKVQNRIILKNSDFVEEISAILQRSGHAVRILKDPVTGDVQQVAEDIVDEMRAGFSDTKEPFFLVAGGETTVTVHGKGIGGRNCQLSVLVSSLFGRDEDFVFTSLGTDGIDGVSPAMGGITDSVFRSEVTEDEVAKSVADNDTYTLLAKHRSAVISGFTGNNVSDIMVCYYAGKTRTNLG